MLRAQDKVNPERSTTGRDIGEYGVDVGKGIRERRELVDHDDEPREKFGPLGEISDTRIDEGSLSPSKLGTQTVHCALGNQRVKIRDESHGVW